MCPGKDTMYHWAVSSQDAANKLGHCILRMLKVAKARHSGRDRGDEEASHFWQCDRTQDDV